MVTFIDPLTGKEISYYIDERLKRKWDRLRDGKLKKKDEDRVYLIDGMERLGKSVFGFQQAKYLDPTFNIDRICFTPDEFLNQIKTAPDGSVVFFDEAFRGFSSKSALSRINKSLVQAMMEIGQRNLIIFIVLPTFFLLEMYMATIRSHVLFHIYKTKRGKRAWRLYTKREKALLYQVGRKKGFSYSIPRVRVWGDFFNIYAIDEKKYRKKKLESLTGSTEEEVDIMDSRFQDKYYKLVSIFLKYNKLSLRQAEKILRLYGFEVTSQTLGLINRTVEKNSKELSEKAEKIEEALEDNGMGE